jgi:hypothetical protein
MSRIVIVILIYYAYNAIDFLNKMAVASKFNEKETSRPRNTGKICIMSCMKVAYSHTSK